MGLGITAYSHLTPVRKHTELLWCDNEDHVSTYTYDCFPDSFRGIPALGTVEQVPGERLLYGGCYVITDKTERHSFHPGSYGGYGRWRRQLAEQFNPYGPLADPADRYSRGSPDPDLPFYELIWFADNEGTIGPAAAADLLADFREHADQYAALPGIANEGFPGEHRHNRTRYDDWTRAFELAAQDGLVHFH